MVSFGIPPLSGWQNLRNNLPFPPLLINLFRDFTRDALLLSIMVEDTGAVLRAGIGTLAVRCCGIMHFVEEFEELAVCDLGWVVGHLKGFCICCFQTVSRVSLGNGREQRTASPSRADSPITRALRITPNISHPRIIKSLPLKFLSKHMFNAPETSRRHRSFSCALRSINYRCAFGVQTKLRGG